jgi:hypothetical protein
LRELPFKRISHGIRFLPAHRTACLNQTTARLDGGGGVSQKPAL